MVMHILCRSTHMEHYTQTTRKHASYAVIHAPLMPIKKGKKHATMNLGVYRGRTYR